MMIRGGSYVDGFEPASYYVPYTMYPNKYVSLYYICTGPFVHVAERSLFERERWCH